jgi:Ras-related protein Rab-5C
MSRAEQPRRYKIVLLGPSSAGKTSIIHRYIKSNFCDQRPTIGTAFYSREVEVDGRRLVLNIWDTAGMERYKSLVPRYSKGAAVAIIVFDGTEVASYNAAQEILAATPDLCDSGTRTFFVANKIDARSAVSTEDARQCARTHGAVFIETSAKTGEGIEELFAHAAAVLIHQDLAETEAIPIERAPEKGPGKAAECC